MARHRFCCRLAAAVAAILLTFLLTPPATAQWNSCGESAGNYTANSTYQANLQRLSATLPNNASSSATLFAKDSVGTVPDIVYALALCRGDTNAAACAACVATAFQDAQQLCPYNKEVFIVYDPCYLRFSNLNFLAGASSNGGVPMKLTNTQTVSAPAEVFDAAVSKLLNATSDYAAANSSTRFATGEEAFDTTDPTIYALAQCTPDMSEGDCRSCPRRNNGDDAAGLQPE